MSGSVYGLVVDFDLVIETGTVAADPEVARTAAFNAFQLRGIEVNT